MLKRREGKPHNDAAQEKTTSGVDLLRLSRTTTGGVTNTRMQNWNPTWEEFCDFVTNPRIGQKDGSYFLRGYCDGTRADANMKAEDVAFIVIDAEKSVDEHGENLVYKSNGEAPADKWCRHTLEEASAVLTMHNIQHVGHTTHSHQELGDDYNRFRICIPLVGEAKANWSAAQDLVMNLLHAEGIRISAVAEMKNKPQPWFFPSVPEERKDGFKSVRFDGEPLSRYEETNTRKKRAKKQNGTTNDDLVLNELQKRGLVKQRTNDGGYDITCLWIDKHTQNKLGWDTGTVYYSPSERYPLGGYKCHHDSCEERKILHVLEKLGLPTPTIMAEGGKGTAAEGVPVGVEGELVILPSDPVPYQDAAENIFRRFAENGTLYRRGGQLVEVDGDSISDVGKNAFISRLEGLGQTVSHVLMSGVHVLKQKRCTAAKADGLMSAPQIRSLPNIQMVTKAPLLMDVDGEPRILRGGYHPAHGGDFVQSNATLPEVSLKEAVASLKSILKDYKLSSEGDASRAIAAFLSPCIRAGRFLPRANFPMHLVEADDSQAGKGYMVKIIGGIYHETPALVTKQEGGVGSLDESFASAMSKGHPILQLDNIRGRVDSALIEMVLTSDELVQVRIPHKGNIELDPSHITIITTSNGLVGTPDIANRSSITRLRKQPSDYEFQKFEEGDLLDHIHAGRDYYLACVFAVVSEWVRKGKPRTAEHRHDFRVWTQSLDWIVQKLMGMAPLMEGHDKVKNRLSSPILDWLRSIGLELERTDQLGEPVTAADMVEVSDTLNLEIPSYRGRGDPMQIVGRPLGKLFNDAGDRGVEIDHLLIRRAIEEKHYEAARTTKDIKTYFFTTESGS